MSNIYGDSIFESTDSIINRLLESLDNDSLLFEKFEYITEDNNDTFWADFKKFVATVINKIVEVVKKIIQKIKDVKNKVKTELIYKHAISQFKKHPEYDGIYVIDEHKFNDLTYTMADVYKSIESADLNNIIANEDDEYLETMKQYDKDIRNFWSSIEENIKTEVIDKKGKKSEPSPEQKYYVHFSKMIKLDRSKNIEDNKLLWNEIKNNINSCFKVLDSFSAFSNRANKMVKKLESTSNNFSHTLNTPDNSDINVHFAASVIRATIDVLKDIITSSKNAVSILTQITECHFHVTV